MCPRQPTKVTVRLLELYYVSFSTSVEGQKDSKNTETRKETGTLTPESSKSPLLAVQQESHHTEEHLL